MAKSTNPFRYFDSSPEVIRLVVMMYVKYPLSLRNVEDLLAHRGIDICHETVRLWWNRFGPMFAAEIRRSGCRGAVKPNFTRQIFPRHSRLMHDLWKSPGRAAVCISDRIRRRLRPVGEVPVAKPVFDQLG